MGFHQTKKFMCSKENDQQNKAELTEQGKYLPTICPASNWYSECRVFVHVYVCKCTVCVFAHVCRCVCMCLGQRTILGAILQQVSTLFSSFSPLPSPPLSFLSPLLLSSFSLPSFYLRQILSLARSSPRRLDWPVSEPRDLPISTTSLTSLGFQVCTTTPGFLCKLWESNSDPWAFAESILWLSYLSSPKMYLLMVCIRSSHRHQCSGLDVQSAVETLGGEVWVGHQVKAFAG